MESIKVCFNAIMPMFLAMLVGYLAKTFKILTEKDGNILVKIAFNFFLPASVFNSIIKGDITSILNVKLIIFTVVALFVTYFIAYFYTVLTDKSDYRRGVKIQGMFRGNTGTVGLPLAESLLAGTDGLGVFSIAMAIIVPLLNVLAVLTLERFSGQKSGIKNKLVNIIKNPLIIASIFGIAISVLKIELPYVVAKTVSQFASATAPASLFALGVIFEFSSLNSHLKDVLEATIMKLVILPGLILVVAYSLGFRNEEIVTCLALFTIPTSTGSFAMAKQMGGDHNLAGDIIVITSILSIITIFIFTFIFKYIGAF